LIARLARFPSPEEISFIGLPDSDIRFIHFYARANPDIYYSPLTETAMAQRHIETVIEIEAPASRVWNLLTDFASMPSWNPFITSISGKLAQGERLAVDITPPGKSPMHFKPRLLVVHPERELRWLGHFLFKGVFDGEHYFLLDPFGDTRTRFRHGEIFSGLLVSVLAGTLPATQQGFDAMNSALKHLAES
jgi:hypothetical protein